MPSLCLIRWLAAFSLIGLVASTHAGALTIEGRIVGITDGDSITLLDAVRRQHKIRLDGIEAPWATVRASIEAPLGQAAGQP